MDRYGPTKTSSAHWGYTIAEQHLRGSRGAGASGIEGSRRGRLYVQHGNRLFELTLIRSSSSSSSSSTVVILLAVVVVVVVVVVVAVEVQ